VAKKDDNNTLFFPGFEPETESPGKNGKNSSGKKKEPVTAELEVPEELDIIISERKWQEKTVYQGKWHDSIHYGNNIHTLQKMPDETVDLILTDPPYAINYKSNRRVKNPKFNHLENDNSNEWIPEFAQHSYRVLKNNRHLYCFCRHDTYPEFLAALSEAGFKIKRTLIWVKNNHGSGDLKGDYAPQDEWIIYAHKGRRNLFGKRHSNVLMFDKLSSKKLSHATEKPVKLLKFLIGKSTEEGELVLDPFSGSGSTLHAAIEMERSYCVIELSPNYFLTSKEREKTLKQNSFSDQLYKLK